MIRLALALCVIAAPAWAQDVASFRAVCYSDPASLADAFGGNPEVIFDNGDNGIGHVAMTIRTDRSEMLAIAIPDGRLCVLWSRSRPPEDDPA